MRNISAVSHVKMSDDATPIRTETSKPVVKW